MNMLSHPSDPRTLATINRGPKKALARLLDIALKKDQIWPGYQPIIDMRSGEVAGFEVLARWSDPDEGEISPSAFIGPLERLGLIDRLSDTLLEKACAEASLWPGTFFLAFNLSPQQLSNKNLPSHIEKIVRRTEFPLARVEMEVTEGALISDIDQAHKALRDLDALGVRIAIDDFGTGYSNLERLESFPFRKLKIDRRFVCSIDTDQAKRRIAASIIGLGQNLGISVVAEGVETKEEENTLKAFGCDFGQGWLYGRALHAKDAKELASTSSSPVGRPSWASSPFQRLLQLEALYRLAPAGLCFVDLEFRHVRANERFASMHGLTPSELEGKSIYDVMDEPMARRSEELLTASLTSDRIFEEQYRFHGRDMAVFNSRVADTDGSVIGYSVVAIDVTDKVDAQRLLAMREEHIRRVLELNPDICWSTGPDGIFDYISPTNEDLPTDTMRDRINRWFGKIHPEDQPEVVGKWFDWIPCEQPYSAEFRVLDSRGAVGSAERHCPNLMSMETLVAGTG
ncbi:EAL domain-containing protein [Agrobacterium sp. CNPSo 2736]|uniref:sensor domain-containing phosphodiesterase n=1 Tax=Agrobacterium sp. CNPSo 2736 TaxID=2499627 RepID=UPI000FD7881C|nr:EAL domain-containing protein [Agrobacterium sp. CNPSo 2736]RVT69880.1 EAL domain-containing protein [Agrobacterium sp. CNPSo 2736]